MQTNWVYHSHETRGKGCPDKLWLKPDGVDNPEKNQLALFKPDTKMQKRPESQIELSVSKIAKALDIKCTSIEPFVYDGDNGVVSPNFKLNSDEHYIAAGKLFPDPNFPVQPKEKTAQTTGLVDTLSFQEICEKCPHIRDDMIKMAYLDCLTSNFDRNSSNWEFELNDDGEILGLAPLFDHGFCMENNHGFDESLIHFEPSSEFGEYPTHFEMFEKLAEHYPKQIQDLLDRTEALNAAGTLDDFCKPRFEEMKERFLEVQNAKETDPYGSFDDFDVAALDNELNPPGVLYGFTPEQDVATVKEIPPSLTVEFQTSETVTAPQNTVTNKDVDKISTKPIEPPNRYDRPPKLDTPTPNSTEDEDTFNKT
jgi:hypothetical protein